LVQPQLVAPGGDRGRAGILDVGGGHRGQFRGRTNQGSLETLTGKPVVEDADVDRVHVAGGGRGIVEGGSTDVGNQFFDVGVGLAPEWCVGPSDQLCGWDV